MTSLMIGLYGIYLVAVGVKNNTNTLVGFVEQDVTGFVPWLAVIIVILAMYDVPALKNVAEAFAVLIIATWLVSNRSNVIGQFEAFYKDISTGNFSSASSADTGLTASTTSF
jgi:hypothetical protein